MKRRDFVTRVTLGSLGALVISKVPAFALPAKKVVEAAKKIPTIAQIISASWLSVVNQGKPFYDERLNQAVKDGRIKFMGLGAVVEAPIAGVNGIGKKLYDIQQLGIPAVWSKQDDRKNDEKGRIRLATSLMENVIISHDDMLLEKLEGARMLVVSKEYFYERSEIHQVANSPSFYTLIYTAFARID